MWPASLLLYNCEVSFDVFWAHPNVWHSHYLPRDLIFFLIVNWFFNLDLISHFVLHWIGLHAKCLMPKCARLQMVEQLHLGNSWKPHQAALVPMVHFPPMSHAAINLCCLRVLLWDLRAHLHWDLSSCSLSLIPLPLSEHPWKILCAHVDLKFQRLNCYKLELWLAAFSSEAGKNMLGGEREVVSDICLLLCLGPHFCLTMSLTGHCTGPAVCCSMSWGVPTITFSNTQYKLWGSILCCERASSQPAAHAVLQLHNTQISWILHGRLSFCLVIVEWV